MIGSSAIREDPLVKVMKAFDLTKLQVSTDQAAARKKRPLQVPTQSQGVVEPAR
jgi:hypothetical protein